MKPKPLTLLKFLKVSTILSTFPFLAKLDFLFYYKRIYTIISIIKVKYIISKGKSNVK